MPRSLLPDGSNYDVINHSFNGFPVASSAKFGELLFGHRRERAGHAGADATRPVPGNASSRASFPDQPDPAAGELRDDQLLRRDAFQFTGPDGANAYVRYRFVPAAGEHYLDAAALAGKSPTYLMDEIASRVAAAPVEFTWFAQVAQDGDTIEDPSTPWPEERRLVKLGTVRIDAVEPHSPEADRALFFLPGSTPPGIAIADPMLTIRNAAYPVSYAERSTPA